MARWPQYTDDPAADYDAFCRQQDLDAARLPVCCECDSRIEEEFCYEINGEVLCETCMEQYKRFTADLME